MGVNLARSGDTVIVSWLEPATPQTKPSDEKGSWALRFSRLENGAWTAPATVTSGTDFYLNWADIPSVVDAGGGKLAATWAIKTGSMAYDIGLATSEDGGKTWKKLSKVNEDATVSEHGFISLLPDSGQVRAFWLDGRERKGEKGAQTLRTAVLSDKPAPSERLDERVCDTCHTSAAMTSDGPIVVYRDRTEDDVRDVGIIRRTEKGWTKGKLIASDGWHIAGCPINGPAVAAAEKTVAVVWFTAAKDKPKVEAVFSSDSGANFGKPVVVDGAGPLGRVGVVLDGSDAIVLWGSTEGKAPSIRLRRVSADGKLGQPYVVAPTAAARTSGFPHVHHAGENLVLAWLEPSEPTRVHAALVPASAVK